MALITRVAPSPTALTRILDTSVSDQRKPDKAFSSVVMERTTSTPADTYLGCRLQVQSARGSTRLRLPIQGAAQRAPLECRSRRGVVPGQRSPEDETSVAATSAGLPRLPTIPSSPEPSSAAAGTCPWSSPPYSDLSAPEIL